MKYKLQNNCHCLTKCSFLSNKGRQIFVGSVYCKTRCKNFISEDKENQIIECKLEKIKE